IIDVRNPEEWEIARIPGATLLPLPELEARMGELSPEDDLVLHCKSGIRSAKALKLLQEQGFKHLKNMTGGILAWSDEVDPTIAERAGGVEKVEVNAANVQDAVVALAKLHRAIGARIFNCEGALRSVVKVEVNGQAVPADQAANTPVSEGDVLRLSFP